MYDMFKVTQLFSVRTGTWAQVLGIPKPYPPLCTKSYARGRGREVDGRRRSSMEKLSKVEWLVPSVRHKIRVKGYRQQPCNDKGVLICVQC